LIADPGFSTVLPELSSISPCVNNGEAFANVTTDINGNPRDSFPDIGCFEVQDFILALDTPQNIQISYNQQEGNINLSWDMVNNALSYKIWTGVSPIVDTTGQPLVTTTSTSTSIPVSGSRLFFIIKASTESPRSELPVRSSARK
ncbi:MAG: hypothetical protein JXR56_03845, partial [Candidatus Cloacimonetes bacterium]|nr:hypothetical protein [Candidatus Cloacimonadota bacterium]